MRKLMERSKKRQGKSVEPIDTATAKAIPDDKHFYANSDR